MQVAMSARMRRFRAPRRWRAAIRVLAAGGILALSAAAPASAASGDLDPSFAGDGKQTSNLGFAGQQSRINDVARGPDGKLVVAGRAATSGDGDFPFEFAVGRYTPDGAPDPSFGGDGFVTTPLTDGEAHAVVVQSDGSVVAAGLAGASEDDIAIVRYTPDGGLDESFGGDGVVITDVETILGGVDTSDDAAYGLALDSAGNLVVAGRTNVQGDNDFVLTRYGPDGELDDTFSADGVAITDVGGGSDDVAEDLVIQADGKIVAAGSSFAGDSDVAIARYEPNGSPDATFSGTDGVATEDVGGQDTANAVAIHRTGRLLVAGSTTADGSEDFMLALFNANGAPNTSFGPVLTDFGGHEVARDVAIGGDGRIVAVGYSRNAPPAGADPNYDFALARYDEEGGLDSTFSDDGKLVSDLFPGFPDEFDDELTAVTLQPQVSGPAKIVVAGQSGAYSTTGTGSFVLARFHPNGTVDTSFGPQGGGYSFHEFRRPRNDVGLGMVRQGDGKLVVAGSSDGKFAFARYLPDGSLDTSFGRAGTLTLDDGPTGGAAGLALQPDGKLLAVGSSVDPVSGDEEFTLIRLRFHPTTGEVELDPTFGPNGDGIVTTDFGTLADPDSHDSASAIVIRPDNSILAVGSSNAGGDRDFAAASYTDSGNVEWTVTTDFGGEDFANAVAQQDDGDAILAGATISAASEQDFALARLRRNGSLDDSTDGSPFGGDGLVTTSFSTASSDAANAVIVQPDGAVVVAGSTSVPGGGGSVDRFALARYEPDGDLDPSFGGGDGLVAAAVGGPFGGDAAYALARRDDGRLVAAGTSEGGFALARFLADGSPDTSFGGDGGVITQFSGAAEARAILIPPDGKLVAAGFNRVSDFDQDFAVARYQGVTPVAVLAPGSRDFGARQVDAGPSAPLTFELTNSGDANLTISAIGLGGGNAGDFGADGANCTGSGAGQHGGVLEPGDACTIAVRFDPDAIGSRTASLTVETNGGTPAATLQGTGTPAQGGSQDTGTPQDTSAPDTLIDGGPKPKIRKRRATFEFHATEAGASFQCKLDGGEFVSCTSPLPLKVKRGRHTFAVRATDAAGNTDATPATWKWKVKRKRR